MMSIPANAGWLNVHGPISPVGTLLTYAWNSLHPDGLRALCEAERYHRTYMERGLAVIGVHHASHTAQDTDHVRAVLNRYNITHPVVLTTTTTIEPTEMLLLAEDGAETWLGRDAVEAHVQALLRRRGKRVTEPVRGANLTCMWPVMRVGFAHGLQNSGVERGYMRTYRRARLVHRPTLEDRWRVENEHVVSGGGRCHIPITAGSVYLLAYAPRGASVSVLWNDVPIVLQHAGDALLFEGGGTTAHIASPGPYQVWISDRETSGVLTIDAPTGVHVIGIIEGAPVR